MTDPALTPCPRCDRPLVPPPPGLPDAMPRCPVCERAAEVAPAAAAPGGACPFCLAPVDSGEPAVACPACRASYHDECWRENGGCAVYGCAQVPAIPSRTALEIPLSYWGRENKPCPSCGQEILAAAMRCRHCGATFASARPEDGAEFQRRTDLAQQLPGLRRQIVWLFVFSVVPFLAPIGAAWGIVWYPAHREEVRALPPLFGALCKIGLAASITLTLGMALAAALYGSFRGL